MNKFKQIWNDENQITRFIYAVIIIGSMLRLYKFFISGPVSFDEAYSYWVGSKSILKLMALAAVDKHPPLYYLFMHFWNLFFYSEVWIRIPSLIASILSLIVFVKVSRLVFKSSHLVLLALSLFAVDFSQIQYAAIARSYSIDSLLVLISFWAFFELLDGKNERKWYWINLIANILLTLFIYTGVFVFIAQFVAICILWIRNNNQKPFALLWFKYHLFLIVIFLGLIPYVYNQLSIGGFAPKWIAELVGEPWLETLFLQGTLLNLRLYKINIWIFKISIGSFIALIIFLSAVFKKDSFKFWINRDIKFWSLIIVYGLPPIVFWVISKIEPIFVSRYFMIFYFAYYILLVYALDHLKYIRKLSAVFVLLFVIGVVPLFEAFYTDYYKESDWKSKSEIIEKNWKDGDLLLIIPHADGVRAKFYLKDMKKYKVDLNVYRDIFKSKTHVITDTDLDSVFIKWKYPYKRIWFHEEIKTGLSAEFEVVQKEGFIHHYLDSLYQKVDSVDFKDDRGELSLFILNTKKK